MVAAFEFQNFVAPPEGAGEAHGVQVGLGAAGDEAHLLGAGHRGDEGFGQQDARAVVGEKRGAARHLRLHCGGDLGGGVAHQQRAGAEQEIDVFGAVLGADAAAVAFADHHLGREIAEPAAGQHAGGGGGEVGVGGGGHRFLLPGAGAQSSAGVRAARQPL